MRAIFGLGLASVVLASPSGVRRSIAAPAAADSVCRAELDARGIAW